MSDFQKSSDVGLTRNGPLNALIFSHGALHSQKPQGVLGTGKGVSGGAGGGGGGDRVPMSSSSAHSDP